MPDTHRGQEWNRTLWHDTKIDFTAFLALADTAVGAQTRLAYPEDASRQATRSYKPWTPDRTPWPDDACAYCKFRPLPKAGVPDDSHWWYGTGKGNHNPYRCRAFLRFLCEGGDVAAFPQDAEFLQRCVVIKSREPPR